MSYFYSNIFFFWICHQIVIEEIRIYETQKRAKLHLNPRKATSGASGNFIKTLEKIFSYCNTKKDIYISISIDSKVIIHKSCHAFSIRFFSGLSFFFLAKEFRGPFLKGEGHSSFDVGPGPKMPGDTRRKEPFSSPFFSQSSRRLARNSNGQRWICSDIAEIPFPTE